MRKVIRSNNKFKDIINENSIETRTYQVKIAEACVGKNSLVVIPTGLGKTIIAVLVAAKTLEIFPIDSKIIMMAPTRPLINQHYDTFLKFLNIPEENFCVLTGKTTPEKRLEKFNQNQVLFYTPQTLRNDIVQERYDLSKVCLIIFDEAHHSSGDYPYPMIADKYLEQNPDGSSLALTASPGASKEKITALCKTLHVPPENIHIRTRKDSDVKQYLKPMDLYKVGVNFTGLMDDIHEVIKALIEERLSYLVQMGFLSVKGNKELFQQFFRKDLLALNGELTRIISGDGDKTGAYSAISINAQALILYHMLELVIQQGLDVLMTYLEKINRDAQKKSSSKAVKRLASDPRIRNMYLELKKTETFSEEKLTHPKYQVLKEVLAEEFCHNPAARILVFVKLRDSVRNIVKKLRSNELIKPVRFVGQATKSKQDKGLSQKKQLEILEKFKNGEYNVLVSTNVGEEGLDIAECDMVVFYDVVASEIRLIQRKGRTARHREGKVIILYTKNTHDEVYLNIALRKLKKMQFNLKNKEQLRHHYEGFGAEEGEEDEEGEEREDPTEREEWREREEADPEDMGSQGVMKTQSNLEHFMNASKSSKILGELNSKKNNLSHTRPADITLSKTLPMHFGLRKRLTEDGISFTVTDQQESIVLFDKVLIQVHQITKLEKPFLDALIQNDTAKAKRHVLILHLFDFIDFTEEFQGHKALLKRSIRDHASQKHVKMIPIDTAEELYFILKNIHQNKEELEK